MSGAELQRVHFVGIGGSGMSGLAHILCAKGAVVTGSDMRDSAVVDSLRAAGASVAIGHAADNLRLAGELPTLVVTSFAAIAPDNPELVAARDHDIPVIRRSDLLAQLMSEHTQVLIAGTHGKTSTTSMTVAALEAADLAPSFAIGGQLSGDGRGAFYGGGDVFIAEADESDASLLRYSPDIAVVTNIEPDHLDFFGSAEAYFAVFDEFAARVASCNGSLVVCLDDAQAVNLGVRAAAQGTAVYGYGATSDAPEGISVLADLTSVETTAGGSHITCRLDGWRELKWELHAPGRHMALNSVAALCVGLLTGGNPEKLAQGLSGFGGVKRRFELQGAVTCGRLTGVEVYDDYAHHPTEVAAVLRAARARVEARGKGKVVVLFQPHMYSRAIEFSQQFAEALEMADRVIALDIYTARETAVPGVDSSIITSKIAGSTQVSYEPERERALASVLGEASPGDLIVTMGAGDVTSLGAPLVAALQAASEEDA